jgi:prepilin-type N-terminal cleavage/methylation domain-containing protein
MPRSCNDGLAGRVPGFTLIELMVSTAIGSIILLVLMQSFDQASNSWIGQSRKFSSLREGRSGMRMLSDDFASLTALQRNSQVTTGDDARERFILRAAADDYASASAAFLRAGKPARKLGNVQPPDGGDLRLIMYLVALTSDAGANTALSSVSQKLWRKEFSTADTYSRIQNHLLNATPLVKTEDWTAFAADPAAFGADAVAYDVIRFDVVAYQDLKAGSKSVTPWSSYLVPNDVELTLRTTSRSIASRLFTLQDWQGQGALATKLMGNPPTPKDYSDDAEARTDTLRMRLPQGAAFAPATPAAAP